ncbi:uncharacterized protein LOC124353121 [Homalodisca vitripennis]|uniref:uncharacterized protein LOC124353121 n=1 Tax=Homalodisca vitripennis TaxID=197043 RepID=UPI001EECD275|nr:uncharacterized protein LOC124353121 [Homalodisca vitripennis]
MATFTGAERARCVLLFHESATSIQCRFRTEYRRDPPSRPYIYSWHKNFVEIGCCVRHEESPGRPQVSDATVEHVRETFARSPKKSTRRAAVETGIPQKTVWRVLRRRLHLKPYRLTMVQHITDLFKAARGEFCAVMLVRMGEDETFLNSIIFSDESTFHISGKVNTHNCRIWGTQENPLNEFGAVQK